MQAQQRGGAGGGGVDGRRGSMEFDSESFLSLGGVGAHVFYGFERGCAGAADSCCLCGVLCIVGSAAAAAAVDVIDVVDLL